MTAYAPLNTLKPVAAGLWIIDGPDTMRGFARVPVPSRAVVVQLEDGALWVHAPTTLTDTLQQELAEIGPVAHLVVPRWDHSVQLGDWCAAYPKAQIWAVPGEGARGPGIEFDHHLGGEAPWQTQIAHLIVGGSRRYREAAFFHRASSTLIVSDLIQNIETLYLPLWARPLVWMAGSDDSDGKMPYLMRRSYRKRALLGDAIEHMILWRPRALIMAHGRWFPGGAVSQLERAFKKLVHERQWSRALDEAEKKQEGAD